MATGFISQQSDRSYPGASSLGLGSGWLFGEKFTSPAGGAAAFNITELGIYCENSGAGSGAGTFQMALYDLDGSGDLDNVIGTSVGAIEGDQQDAPENSAAWIAFTGLSISVAGSTDYAIVAWPDDANFDLEGVLSGGTSNCEYNTSPGTPWTWPDLAGVSTNYAREIGIYAVYEAAAGGISIPVVMHHLTKNIGA